MSRVGHCIDNGPMEGFWGILEREMYYGHKFHQPGIADTSHFSLYLLLQLPAVAVSAIRHDAYGKPRAVRKGRIEIAAHR